MKQRKSIPLLVLCVIASLFIAGAAVERAQKVGVTSIKKSYQLGGGNFYLTLVRDLDGNIIEPVGPRK